MPSDPYDLAELAYIQTAQADPELTGFYETGEHQLRAIGRALHGAGWLTPAEAERLRALLGAADPTPVDTVSHRLEELAALEQGWDSYGAYPMQPGIRERIAALLAVLREQPRISLTPSGGGYLTWGSDEDVIIELDPGEPPTVLIEDVDLAVQDPVKVSCPDCVQWSVEGPTAAEQLINHWALIHMRRVSWTAADGGPTIWPPPETCSCGRALPCRHCTQET